VDRNYSIVVQKTGLAKDDILTKLRDEVTTLENAAVSKFKIKFYKIENGVYFYEYSNDAKKVRSEITQSLNAKFPTLGIKLEVKENLSLPGSRLF